MDIYEPMSDAALMGMTKKELLRYIRLIEESREEAVNDAEDARDPQEPVTVYHAVQSCAYDPDTYTDRGICEQLAKALGMELLKLDGIRFSVKQDGVTGGRTMWAQVDCIKPKTNGGEDL